MKKWSLFLMSMFFLIPSLKGWTADFTNIPKLVIRGEASIFRPADQMEVSLGIMTTAENSAQALNENNQRMHQIITNLQALGLDESDYQTGHFHIRPIYQKPSKDSPDDEHAKIIRYEVINAIHVKTYKIDLADKIIGSAVEGGSNQVEQVNFNINNPQAYRQGAIQAAAKNALADAQSLAQAMGVKLKRILSLSLDHWQQFPGPLLLSKQGGANNGEARGQDLFEPGQAEIHATVNVTFEIDQQ